MIHTTAPIAETTAAAHPMVSIWPGTFPFGWSDRAGRARPDHMAVVETENRADMGPLPTESSAGGSNHETR